MQRCTGEPIPDLLGAMLDNQRGHEADSIGTKKLNMLELTGIAASSGALGGLAGNPADIVLVRMVSDPTKPAEKQVHYRNALHGVYKMVKVEGFSSLFRGLLPNTVSQRHLVGERRNVTQGVPQFTPCMMCHLATVSPCPQSRQRRFVPHADPRSVVS